MLFQEVKDSITQEQLNKYKVKVRNELLQLENSNINENDLRNVALIINKFIFCELMYKKLLKSVKDKNNELKNISKNKVKIKDLKIIINEVKAVFDIYNYGYDENLLENIFGSNKSRNHCSIKILRNNILHNNSKKDFREVVDRFNELNEYMDRFLTQIRNYSENE